MNHSKCLTQKAFSNTPALRIVLRRNTGFGQGVEESGLAHVGQAHDSAFERHECFPCKSRPQGRHRAPCGGGEGAGSRQAEPRNPMRPRTSQHRAQGAWLSWRCPGSIKSDCTDARIPAGQRQCAANDLTPWKALPPDSPATPVHRPRYRLPPGLATRWHSCRR